jgi:hypothetical protein
VAESLVIMPVGDRIDAKSVDVTLKPTLIDPQSITKAYKKRRSDFNAAHVHVVDVPAQTEKGWLLVKAGKRHSRMRRPKPISQLLEDRVWCLAGIWDTRP